MNSRWHTPVLVILTYHGITKAPSKREWERVMRDFARDVEQILRLGYPIVNLKTALSEGLSEDSVAITFDDGLKSQNDYAVPILEQFEVPATFFVPAAYIGKGEWNLTNEDLVRLSQRSLFSVESHGFQHIELSKLSRLSLLADLKAARATLSELGIQSNILALPYGGTNNPMMQGVAQQAGYSAVRAARPGPYDLEKNRFDMPSYLVVQDSDVVALLDRRRRWPQVFPKVSAYDR